MGCIVAYLLGILTVPAVWLAVALRQRLAEARAQLERDDAP
jgi:hypothetical protein